MADLEERRVAVVGGASGIGAATVELVRAGGGAAVAVDRAVGAEVVADIGSPEGCELAIDGAVERLGDLDGLVVTAGIGGYADIEHSDAELWRQLLSVDLVAVGLL